MTGSPLTASGRAMSPHSVRAYVADVASLLDHAARMGRGSAAELDLRVLRSWLARLASTGQARSSVARRAAAARSFTAWAVRAGLAETDPGVLLATPKAVRALPGVLRQAEAAALLEVAETATDDGDPIRLRDLSSAALGPGVCGRAALPGRPRGAWRKLRRERVVCADCKPIAI